MPPPKKLPETDAIFDHLKQVHEQAAQSDDTLRLSMDAKMAVPIGDFSRGGSSRVGATAFDHDFKPDGHLTPFGLFLPAHDELDIVFTDSKVTSDFIVDVVEDWWQRNRERFTHIRSLLLDLDNGPENCGTRSQFLRRLVEFSRDQQLTIQLAYYPPYHSKYNPIERCWGVLENYWRGELLNSEEAILGYAGQMTWKGQHPTIHRNNKTYNKGVRLTKDQRRRVERHLDRHPDLQKWALTINPPAPGHSIV
jgi:Rhodopirellula transposase DDE domain